MTALFALPDELVLASLLQAFPGRDDQIRSLATLIHPRAAPCRNIVVYGPQATGKSVVVERLLQCLAASYSGEDGTAPAELNYAILNSIECVTGRHLFERTVAKVASALGWDKAAKRCETLSQLTAELSRMLREAPRPHGGRFVLVFDSIDRQGEAPATLLPALARLSEMIPGLTTIFIVTPPPSSFLRTSFVPQIQFPNYSKSDFVRIVALAPPAALPSTTAEETGELWTRFCGAVHDALVKAAARTLPALRQACEALWPRFVAPILSGTLGPREFSKLLVASRVHFQDESLLDPGVIAARPPSGKLPTTSGGDGSAAPPRTASKGPDLSVLLPATARLLLLSAYLASHNATKHDLTLFSTHHHGRRRRRGGFLAGAGRRGKHRKIPRKLLGAHAFVLERMLAIFAAVRSEWAPGAVSAADMDGDVAMALATLASLRLLLRVGGGGDLMDRGGKWRVNVGWEVVRALGRSVAVELEEWLID